MKIDDSLILNIEKLAKLNLSSEERSVIKTDLNHMLELVSKMDEVNTDGVEPLIHLTENVNIKRNDQIGEHQDVKSTMANAPNSIDNYFAVPKFLKK